jgi:4-hydroxy-tetrahydrodipicolinate reductase
MLKIAISGAAGRMGRRLVALTLEGEGLALVAAVEHDAHTLLGQDAGTVAGVSPANVAITSDIATAVQAADVMIDFSSRDAAVDNTKLAVANNCGIILGTTGLTDDEKATIASLGNQGAVMAAPNMSVGVNLLFLLCEQAAKTLDESYDIEVVDMHHNQKKDSPSGTAERLGEILADARGYSYADDVAHGREGMVGARPVREIGMHALRGGDIVGDHTVIFATAGERIELGHRATSRDAFAKGAIRAARFVAQAGNGNWTMRDVLGL